MSSPTIGNVARSQATRHDSRQEEKLNSVTVLLELHHYRMGYNKAMKVIVATNYCLGKKMRKGIKTQEDIRSHNY